MLALAGTIPDNDIQIVAGSCELEDSSLDVNGHRFPVNRGTCAMIAASAITCKSLKIDLPFCILSGDTGKGLGSQNLYNYIAQVLPDINPKVLCFHYIQPELNLHNKVLKAINNLSNRPILIADAGYMYVAKMSGHASEYDLFTPDTGELAFLADELAPHPFYTRGFIFHDEIDLHEKIKRAYDARNASDVMIIKGETDYVVSQGKVIASVKQPLIESLEPIGGTGDTVTGIVTALIHSGISVKDASILACRINRIAGQLANPNPASQVIEIIKYIPTALEKVQQEFSPH